MIQHTQTKTVSMSGNTGFTLTVSIGFAQSASTVLKLNGKVIATLYNSFTTNLPEVKLGDELKVISSVSDLPSNMNRIYVKHRIEPTHTEAEYDDTVSDGDMVIDTTEFYFIA